MEPTELRSSRIIVVACTALLALTVFGCGTVQEGTTDDEWTNTPPVSVTARLEYRIDSLSNENRKLQQQAEAALSENRNLAARNTELENKSKEGSVMPQPLRTPSTPVSPSRTTGGYEDALAKFKTRNFQGAIEQFNELLGGGISSDLADNCHYWIGESYFGMKRYNDAIQHFEVVLGMQGSDKADDAQFMIGNSYAAIGKKAEAKSAFQKLIANYPGSQLIKRARTKMSAL